jgi:hypothetical protein
MNGEGAGQSCPARVGEPDGAVGRCASRPVEFEEPAGHGSAKRAGEVIRCLGLFRFGLPAWVVAPALVIVMVAVI